MAMLRPDNVFLIFGIILLLLASISVISFTSKFIFGLVKTKPTNVCQQIYDPDIRNASVICPFAANTYQIHYNRTVCFNRTMYYRYIPWIRFDVWKKFGEINEEKRREHEKKLGLIGGDGNEINETQNENDKEEVELREASVNRKDREEPSKVVCTILAALLVVSSIVAFFEVFRDLSKRNSSARVMNDKFSSRDSPDMYIRLPTEGQRQEAVRSAKVTQTLVHQTSLDRAFSRLSSEVVKPFYLRRGSVPSQMTDYGVTSKFQDSGYVKETHLFLNDTPEIRRGSRHFIRRH